MSERPKLSADAEHPQLDTLGFVDRELLIFLSFLFL